MKILLTFAFVLLVVSAKAQSPVYANFPASDFLRYGNNLTVNTNKFFVTDRGSGTNVAFYERVSFFDRDTGAGTDGFTFETGFGNRAMFASGSVSNFIIRNASFQIRSVAGSSANIQEWQNSSGTALAWVSSGGVFNGSGLGLTVLDANSLATGTVPTPRLGSGVADSTTYLRGDSTWQPISSISGTSNNVWATIANGGALISSNGTRLFIFNAEPWIGTNYFKLGEPSQPGPVVFQATVRGLQFTDGTSVTNVEANAFNAVASTNTTGWFIGNRLDPANPGRISMTSTGMVFGNAVLAPTNLTARAGTFTSALTFPSGGTGGALLTTADGVAGLASDGNGILLLGNQGQNMWMRPNAYMAVPAACEIGWAVPGANLSGGLSVGFSNSIVGVEAINGSTSRTNFAAAGYFNNAVSVAVGFTLTATNSTVVVTADSQTITLPTAVGIRGRSYTIKSRSAGGCSVASTSSQTFDGAAGPVTVALNQSRTYEADDTGNWVIKSGF